MNLLSKFHKNSILTGPVESYCLACGCILRSEEDCYAHIHESRHAAKLESLPQLENYKEDCIIKIKEGYFCPYCNIILPTTKRVSLHVKEAKHIDSKYSQSITRISDNIEAILAFDEVVISDRAWHGLDGSTCFVCNEDYDDEEQHKTEVTHVLNLIQYKCELGDKIVYRRVDEDLFFCLICNDILPISNKVSHHESVTHLDLYEKSKKEAIEIRNNNKTSVNELNNNKVLPLKPTNEDKKINKNTSDSKSKIQNDKAHNGSVNIIENNNCETQKNTPQPEVLNTKNAQNTEKILSSLDQNKSVNESILKEKKSAPDTKYSTPKTQKVEIGVQNKKTQETKSNTDKVKTEANKPIVQTKNAENLPKASEPKKSDKPKETSKSEKNIETEKNEHKASSDDIDSYLYEHLKSRNFIIKAGSNASYCSLCDIAVPVDEIIDHQLGNHHKTIYAKHIKRNNAKRNANGMNKPSDTNGKSKIDSCETNDAQKKTTPEKKSIIKPAAKTVIKDSTEKTLVNEPKANQITETKPQNFTDKKYEQKQTDETKNVKIDKENTVPDNKTSETRNSSVNRQANDSSVKTDHKLSQKAIRKAQKKAIKEKLAETRAQERQLQIPIETEASTQEDNNLKPAETNLEHEEVNGANLVAEQNTANKEHNDDEITTNSTLNGDMEYTSDTQLKTERLADILKTASQVDSSPEDLVINGKYVLENLSFVFIMKSGGKTECVACDETLTADGVLRHIASDGHRTNMEDCLVVTSLDDEFIRQVKSQAYHCGYCNVLLQSTTELHSHIQSYCHGDAKTSAEWRLQRYRPGLAHPPTREVRELLTAIFRCTHS